MASPSRAVEPRAPRSAVSGHPAGAAFAIVVTGGTLTAKSRAPRVKGEALLEVLPQIHSRVQRCDLIAVPVEGQRLSHHELSKPAFDRLVAERRGRWGGVHVCIEAVVVP